MRLTLNEYLADPEQRANIAERFWAKVDKTPGQGPKGECWMWTASVDTRGYGNLRVGGRAGVMQRAHRICWGLLHGPLPPPPLYLLHTCDERRCVRCTYVGTAADNVRDTEQRARGRHPAGDAHGRRKYPERFARGERHPSAKLTEAQVRTIRADERPIAVLARLYGVSRRTIKAIKVARSWKHVA